MRFDYSGTGDSAGEGAEFGLSDWLDDIVAAAAELRRESGSQRLVLVGLRLGATLAALASARRELRVRHLVLWDPVLDGARHLRDLASAHRAYMRSEMGSVGWPDRLRVDASGVPSEALGSEITPAFAAELQGVDLVREPPRAEHLTVVSSRPLAEVAPWRAQLAGGATLRWIDLPGSGAWDSDAALNAAVVPMDAIIAILGRIEELSP
jgi:pimeloyl-ACP methyl ester carboxylesterase